MSKKLNLTPPGKVEALSDKESLIIPEATPSIRLVKINPLPDGTYEDAPLAYKTELSAGIDICARIDSKVSIIANRVEVIRTGVRLLVENWKDPPNYVTYAELLPRSSIRKEGVSFLGSGIIDLDFSNEICILATLHKAGGVFCVMDGMAIGQLIFHRAYRPEGLKILQTQRIGGFGSTGN